MTDPDHTMTATAKQLRDALAKVPDNAPVQIWMPGSRLAPRGQYLNLGAIILSDSLVLIKGSPEE
jgi:hypothetical protein